MKYTEVTITCSSMAEELVADLLWGFTDLGVAVLSLQDALDMVESKKVYFDYLEDDVLKGDAGVSFVKAFIPENEAKTKVAEIENSLATLKRNCQFDCGTFECVCRQINSDDWVEVWKKHFKPKKIGAITVSPKWIKCDDDLVVYIDSNLAFGTGEHETTSTCIELMQEVELKGKTVFDVGTGSGILGIAAAKLGAEKVVMTDIDSVAVESAKTNAKLNQVDCTVLNVDLLEGVNFSCDVAIANITAPVLIKLAKAVSKLLSNDGKLILSGILNEQAELCIREYNKVGFTFLKRLVKGEWTSILLVKK